MRLFHPLFVAASLTTSTLALHGIAAEGDVDGAQSLFDKGIEEMAAGRYETGCPAIEQSHRLDPRPGTLFTLAECEAKRGRFATAIRHYDEYLAMYANLSPDKQAKQGDRERVSLEQKSALQPQVPFLRLSLPSRAPRGTVVKLDGAPVATSALQTPMPVDPGEHMVTTVVPGGSTIELRVTVAKGEKKQIDLAVSSPQPRVLAPPVASPPQAPDASTSGRRIALYIAGGTGIAGIAVGAIAGGLMLGKKSIIEKDCVEVPPDEMHCKTAEGVAAGNAAKTLGLISTIGFGAGVAGLGTATVLFLTEPAKPDNRVSSASRVKHFPTKNSQTIYVRGGFLGAGQTGIVVGIRRTW